MASGASMKQFIHYGQIGNADRFQQFDYGSENQKRYGNMMTWFTGGAKPPKLQIENIKVPIGMFVGKIDVLATPKDNRYVKSLLKTVDVYEELDDFDHSSF